MESDSVWNLTSADKVGQPPSGSLIFYQEYDYRLNCYYSVSDGGWSQLYLLRFNFIFILVLLSKSFVVSSEYVPFWFLSCFKRWWSCDEHWWNGFVPCNLLVMNEIDPPSWITILNKDESLLYFANTLHTKLYFYFQCYSTSAGKQRWHQS